jgi:hypothetical protein
MIDGIENKEVGGKSICIALQYTKIVGMGEGMGNGTPLRDSPGAASLHCNEVNCSSLPVPHHYTLCTC